MGRTVVAGVLLMCMACCAHCLSSGETAVSAMQEDVCPDPAQAGQAGQAGSACRYEDVLDDGLHHCVDLGEVWCDAVRYMSEGSMCLYTVEHVIFVCRSGVWTTDGQLPELHRHKRFFGLIAAAVVGGLVACAFLCGSGGGGGTVTEYVTNKAPTFTHCPDSFVREAPRGETSVTVTWTIPTASDPEGKEVTVERISGQEPNTVFAGQTSVGYKARDEDGVSEYCWFTVQVQVIKCDEEPPFIRHGSKSCSERPETIYGSVCTYTCDNGYQISNSSETLAVECQHDAQWNGTFPACEPISCGDPGGLTNGDYTCPFGHVYPELCYVTCHTGYQQKPRPSFIRCTSKGDWTSAQACTDVQAPSFPNGCPPNLPLYSGPLESPAPVTWTDPDVSDNSGLDVTLTSDVAKGAELGPGFHVIRITATDMSGNAASCNFVVTMEARKCNPLSTPADSAMTCTQGYVEGSECTVTCQSGHTLQGSATLTCLDTEQWDNAEPVCQAVQCPAVPEVDHGLFDCPGGTQFPSVCTLRCQDTFELRSAANIKCQENGAWSQPGECHDISPPNFPDGCPANIEEFASRLGETTTVSWTPPVADDNSGQDVTLSSTHQPGSVFTAGATQVTYTATDHLGNSKACHFSVTVSTLVCEAPSFGQYMEYTCDDGYVHGANCTLGCTNSFPLVGAGSIACEREQGTFPPEMSWQWDPVSGRPECIETRCSDLTAPKNGALTCFQGNFAKNCFLSCHQDWDVPRSTDGKFVCPNDDGIWYPSATVPDCTVRHRPRRTRASMSIYYYPNTCQQSLGLLKANFQTRLDASGLLDSCGDRQACVVQNLQVFCGEETGRKRRSSENHHRVRRQSSNFYLQFSFDVVMSYTQENDSDEGIYQARRTMAEAMYATLQTEAESGHFNLGSLTTGQHAVDYPTLSADCPPGTLFLDTQTTTTFSCAGCAKGHYLAENSDQCQQCPVGQYTDVDSATACTPCPEGWSTLTTASTNSSQCRELCTAGHYSHDGFVPCQSCPPGRYQPGDRGTACRPCPASTWTSGAATSLDQCLPADAHLSSNTSLNATVTDTMSSLRLAAYLRVDNDSVVNTTFTFDGLPSSLSVYLYTSSGTPVMVPADSEMSASLSIEAGRWSRLVLAVTPSKGTIEVSYDNTSLLTYTQNQYTNVLVTAVSIYVLSGKAIVSGLHADNPAQGQPNVSSSSNNDSIITSNTISCQGQTATNQLVWSVPVTAVQTPSICDAVDECLSSPCAPGHGTCHNLVGGFTCHCHDGWSGDTCHVAPEACYQHQCQNGATCQPGVSNYTCLCDQRHAGTLCQLTVVDGGFGEWSEWSNCTATCEGQQHRQRHCNNPAPLNGGLNCSGQFSQTQSCGQSRCPVEGGWGSWTEWEPCSVTCGGGQRWRYRDCDSPLPLHGGSECDGLSYQTEVCGAGPCPVDGGWREWSDWTPCSVTCGTGQRSRARACDDPAPAYNGSSCEGNLQETEVCRQPDCPVCSVLERRVQKSTVLTCEETTSPYLKTCNLTCAPGYVSSVLFPLYVCGEATGHLWNNQMAHSKTVLLPDCTKPKTPEGANFVLHAPMEADCGTSVNEVTWGLEANMDTLPCANAAGCRAKVYARCKPWPGGPPSPNASGRKRRSAAESLEAVFEMTVDFGASTTLEENDTATIQKYAELLSLAEESARMVAQNDTERLFTVAVEGAVIGPDLSSVSYSGALSCSPGSSAVSAVCVECPAGSMEVEGECVLCPRGQYQDQVGSTHCKPCPPGFTWDLAGAEDITQCTFATNITVTSEPEDDNTIVLAVCAAVVAFLVVVAVIILVFVVKRGKTQAKRGSSEVPELSPNPPDEAERAPNTNVYSEFPGKDKPEEIVSLRQLSPPDTPSQPDIPPEKEQVC